VFPVRYELHLHIQSGAIPVTGRGGLWDCEISWIPHCLDNRLTDGCEVLLEAESNLGPSVAGSIG
jgi:hypothetical protein